MDRYERLIRKISKRDYLMLLAAMKKVLAGDLSDEEVKKLKGFRDLYRIRRKKYRVVFRKSRLGKNVNDLVAVGFRNQVYKKLR
ncbi:type II toxin-antitoxin system RelE/ParE family toxin [Candidatus Peregrinibacteria bacterium]|jgi:mRNA-degrading endonuclease RelE of RelBE toxin-antitoxin system|nr:type II toxin-antitoxin system RelE/ParE family toxin [Candidatus Peregrinibacteria bacterium]MBT4056379.1 type II toxin-antitoxin system RelE/ParE family toxin [Candidatus Peregrinibacteria bacterium]